MWLNVKTGYSFGRAFGRIDDIVKKLSTLGEYAGIADLGNTFGHVKWSNACKKYGIKPIFGVQLAVVEDLDLKERRYPYNPMTFIAKNNEGLAEIYKLVDLAHEQFYYRERLSYEQVNGISSNVVVLSGVSCQSRLIGREDVFQEANISNPKAVIESLPTVATIDNYYINPEDKETYEPFSDKFKRENKTSLMHIPTKKEWISEVGRSLLVSRRGLLRRIADDCNATLPEAPMVKYPEKVDFRELCLERLNQAPFNDLIKYNKRLNRELDVIEEKNFQDYFLIVADLVKYAKTKMAVGPARGSAAGSLICYLLGITEVDPIKYGLYFERFIDLNRADLPDIDIDFQDDKRHLVVKYLEKKYGKENVAQIANVNRLKPKSALTRVAKSLHIPLEDVEEIKNITVNIKDTFDNSEIGKNFLEKYPAMIAAAKVEGHPSHTGVHAAGVLVSPQPISNFCGIDSRDKKRIAMIDKRDAESLNLLKIDALGLRTLTIIANVCDAIEEPYEWIYSLPTDDKAAFEVFNNHRFSGVFQFEGDAVKSLAIKMPIENIEDISALSAIGRPGPLGSGAAWDYVNARAGRNEIKWISENPLILEATKETFGVIIYQEQVMRIVREVGGFSWEETGAIRKSIAKSKGDEIDKFKKGFVAGAVKNGLAKLEAYHIWEQIETFGGYAFNKSHSISYGLISYYCAYLKAHHPLEFTMACLNNSKDDNSALKILRDAVENDGVNYSYISPNNSIQKWSVDGGILFGGFTSIHGIGPAMANKIVKYREEDKPLPAGIKRNLRADISPFKYLYPAKEVYGEYYSNHERFGMNNPPTTIAEIKGVDGSFNVIGKLIEKTPRDENEAPFVARRNGQYLKGQTAYLILKIEDDTDEIRCKINSADYERLGKEITESVKIDADWFLVHGQKINGWNILFVKNIKKITRKI